MSVLQEQTGRVLEGRVTLPDDDQVEKDCPELWEYLTLDQYNGGVKRMLPEITVNRVPGGYEIALKDHELCQQLSTFSPTLGGLAGALEAAMHDPTKAWKVFQSYRNRKGPKILESAATSHKAKKRVK